MRAQMYSIYNIDVQLITNCLQYSLLGMQVI